MMKTERIFFIVVVFIIFVILLGGVGYFFLFLGKYRLIDCIYMTVITITGVGYGEILDVSGNDSAKIFTMFLIILGMGIIAYGVTSITALFIEGELTGLIKKRKMEDKIKKLSNHYILCGGGETGRPLMVEMSKNDENIVLIEFDDDKIKKCESVIKGLLYIQGDATEEQNLIDAGIERAKGLFIALPSDKDNLYITISSRMLNSDIRIITRMTDKRFEAKLKKAGADRIISPNSIGALRMASEMIRPTAVDFLDKMLRSQKGDLRIHEIIISENSPLNGKRIMDSGLKDKYGLLVLGSKNLSDDEIKFNPPPTCTLKKGMTLIIMGEVKNIIKAKKNFKCDDGCQPIPGRA
ncbi:MAG: potassium channel protein [Desulfobacterales bacterium]|nr:potassium channel protein [Desulfobacterales bacterium]